MTSSKKRIIILGSTGSIGENTVKVALALRDRIQIVGVIANRNIARLAEQAGMLGCSFAATAEGDLEGQLSSMVPRGCRAFGGEESIAQLAANTDADMLLCASVGINSLGAVLSAIDSGKDIALATKEVLVAAGAAVMRAAAEKNVRVVPVDSEHSAIFQCLQGHDAHDCRITLTASGGPFRKYTDAQLEKVSWEDAMKHPVWKMGPKVTFDSATLMNKALEMIEAHHLFNVPPERIRVLVHPQSIVHSMVTFADGSTIAQMSVPDMRFPIQYALTYPERCQGGLPGLDLVSAGPLTFEEPDAERFPAIALAYKVMAAGGASGAVMNAANETAVRRFAAGDIKFTDICSVAAKTVSALEGLPGDSLEALLDADRKARETAAEI